MVDPTIFGQKETKGEGRMWRAVGAEKVEGRSFLPSFLLLLHLLHLLLNARKREGRKRQDEQVLYVTVHALYPQHARSNRQQGFQKYMAKKSAHTVSELPYKSTTPCFRIPVLLARYLRVPAPYTGILKVCHRTSYTNKRDGPTNTRRNKSYTHKQRQHYRSFQPLQFRIAID